MKTTVLALAVFAFAAPAAASRVAVSVTPATVSPGGSIRVTGTRTQCLSSDSVFAISAAFPGDQFGGEEAVSGRVRHGSFSIVTHVRKNLHAGRYTIGFRCGGGNLGVFAAIRVR